MIKTLYVLMIRLSISRTNLILNHMFLFPRSRSLHYNKGLVLGFVVPKRYLFKFTPSNEFLKLI